MASTDGKQKGMVATKEPSMSLTEIDIPKPGPGQLVVEISHVAQNPTDVKSFDAAAFGDGAVYGCDFVGKVVQLGEGVTNFSEGDVIAALIWGGEIKGLGAYAQYTLADQDIAFKVAGNYSKASAATIPLALTTAWLAMWSKTCLNMSRGVRETILVWGGSSSVGQYAIQMGALHGLNVITTCSPKNFDLVKSLGAAHVFDYNDSEVVEKIRNVAPHLKNVFDTIGDTSSSAKACSSAVENCTLCTVRPGKANTENVPKSVKITDVLVWTAFLKDHYYGKFHWPPSTEDHELCADLYRSIPNWLKDGSLKANDVLPLKGLKSLPEGFQWHRDGKISGRKVVYEL